jgi:hypothetical protein
MTKLEEMYQFLNNTESISSTSRCISTERSQGEKEYNEYSIQGQVMDKINESIELEL